ncbi:unnamed protein product [Ostreobium quekettii]|uniref:Uncharacterized protein n=1 Tax=Ostreobium quekettii TaxID=121088 RepID=A0A8S1J9T1_9CHLO|nr:unnamed protein product [Ostreobium quekettii]
MQKSPINGRTKLLWVEHIAGAHPRFGSTDAVLSCTWSRQSASVFLGSLLISTCNSVSCCVSQPCEFLTKVIPAAFKENVLLVLYFCNGTSGAFAFLALLRSPPCPCTKLFCLMY